MHAIRIISTPPPAWNEHGRAMVKTEDHVLTVELIDVAGLSVYVATWPGTDRMEVARRHLLSDLARGTWKPS